MSKAFSAFVNAVSMKNAATTTMGVYTAVRLCTTNGSVDIITTRGTVPPYGITQEAINPGQAGAIAISGISRLKMGSTAYSTVGLSTTPMNVGVNASGNGIVLTTSVTLHLLGIGMATFAASDISHVEISKNRAVYRI